MGCASSHSVVTTDKKGTVTVPQQRGPVVNTVPMQMAAPGTQPAVLVSVQQPLQPQPLQPQPQPPPPPAMPKGNISENLKRFQAVNPVIIELERKNIVVCLENKFRQQRELEAEIASVKRELDLLDIKMKKELQDVTSLQAIANSSTISSYFQSKTQFDEEFSKEEEEYIQAKSEFEDCHKKISGLQEESSKISAELDDLKRDKNELLNLYEQLDIILENVFGGVYGSTLEDQLEGKHDQMQDKLQRIGWAMNQWKQCQKVCAAAIVQLEVGCRRWLDIQHLSTNAGGQIIRVQAITVAKNHLSAASKNLAHIQRLVHPVKIPYCEASELRTLNQAIYHIYVDGMRRERLGHAYQVYRTMHARSMMLEKWIDNVVQMKISVDFANARREATDLRKALRKERLRLIEEKAQAEGLSGGALGINVDEALQSIESAEEELHESASSVVVAEAEKVEDAQSLDDEIAKAKAEKTEENEDEIKEDDISKPSLEELAPPPSKNDLFGDLDSMMAQYDQQRKALEEEQEKSKARQEADFRERLKRRRSRKMRLEAQGVIVVEPESDRNEQI